MINIIAAVAKNQVIGKDNKLPWHIQEDLSYFRNITQNSILIMGKNTYQSINRPLKDRFIIVVSHNRIDTSSFEHWSSDIDSALKFATDLQNKNDFSSIFICGGQQIYQQTIDMAEKLYITHINRDFEGNKFFPKIDKNEFSLSSKKSMISADGIKLDFCIYEK